ncbi:hypothetical protein [Streptomyces sp. NPDC001268]|uniref:AMIN-like domain-containing (lipo)protein n=1 Tax=Streptomyces sp. NPDC001268 TaxID=3364553 RepID=UPI00368C19FA
MHDLGLHVVWCPKHRECTACGFAANADHVGAANVLNRAGPVLCAAAWPPRRKPARLRVGGVTTGDFEGYVTFGAAFDSKPLHRTTRLHPPERVVIDVRHPPAGCGV